MTQINMSQTMSHSIQMNSSSRGDKSLSNHVSIISKREDDYLKNKVFSEKNVLDLLTVRPNFIIPEKVNPILDANLKNFKTELKLNMRKVKDLNFALHSQQRKIDEAVSQRIIKIKVDKEKIGIGLGSNMNTLSLEK